MSSQERMTYEDLEMDRDRIKTARDALLLQNANFKVENHELKQQLMNYKDPEDEAWDELEAAIKMRDATAWRKRQIEEIRRVRSVDEAFEDWLDRKSTRLNSSH